MKHKIIYIVLLLAVLMPANAAANNHLGYTEERPLVIASDWDFQPFEFLNADGQPSGYNIEVLDLILTKLDIPHKFVMQEWHIVNELLLDHKADLIHALAYNFKGHPYVSTKKYINYYTLRIVRHINMPPLHSFRHLSEGDTLMLKEDDYAALALQAMGKQPFETEYTSPKAALTDLRDGKGRYFVWGELPLKRKIKELHIDSVALDEIDVPAGELRIIGYDHHIIDLIDEEFTRLEQAGDIQPIFEKWFHPERKHDNASPWALYTLAGLAIASLIAFLFSHIITLRVKKAVHKSADLNSMMKQALSMGAYSVISYDLHTRMVNFVHGGFSLKKSMTLEEFINRISPEGRDEFREDIESMMRGEVDHWTLQRTWNAGTEKEPKWQTYVGSAILEREDGHPRYITHTVKNITRDVDEEAHNQDLGAKYKLLFETNILAMSFYDKDGWLLDINQKMRDICFSDERSEQYFRNTNLFDLPSIEEDLDSNSREPLYICQRSQLKEANLDLFVEIKIAPLFDENDERVFYIVTSRDITAEREMYMQERHHEAQLVKANEAIQRYDQQLSYLLEECKIFGWHYDPKTDLIHFSRKPHSTEFTETLNQFMESIPEKSRAAALIQMRNFISKNEAFNTVYQFNYTPLANEPCWLSISGMPTLDANGQLIEFYGIARDITQLMSAQEQLRQETARAEDSGLLKSAFLANMTHEIRTPLNAIVGFSDLLQMVEEPGERLEFIRIIRNNCDMLLRLINDILEASSMGQSLAIEPKEVDLAITFNEICMSLEQRVQTPGVKFLKENPYTSFTAVLDAGRLQQLLTNFVTNAVKYTQEGHIKVGYREKDNGIYFYCEDTGAGIPKDKQASVFERFVKLNDFVQGTGLGLSICRAIVKKCGGDIGVESEGEGHGSTFWFWIPREITA